MTPRNNSMTAGCKDLKSTPYLTIAAGFARGLIDVAVLRGASRERLLARSGISAKELQDRDHRIPFTSYVALMRAGQELCHDPALALHFGEEVDLSEMSILGLTGSAGSMDDDVARANRYAPLAIEVDGVADRIQLTRVDGQLWMVDTRPNPNEFPEITESFFARMVCGMRRWLGETEFVKAIHVTHAEPSYRAEYDRIFRLAVVFGSDRNAMLLSDEFWPVVRTAFSSPYAATLLNAHAEALLEKLETTKSTRGRVESMLEPMLPSGDASMATIAARLGVSRQTLFRRLKAEGTTFEKVLDQLRHRMAVRMLAEKKVSVNETSYLLGFADPAAFSRAFKRWTGSSPGLRQQGSAGTPSK